MKHTKIVRILVTASLATAAGVSGICQSTVNFPVLTYVLDGTHAIRPLLGIPEAATVGAPVDIGSEIVGAAISPNRDYILGTRSDAKSPILLQLRPDGINVRSISSGISTPSGHSDCADVAATSMPWDRKLTNCPREQVQPTNIAIDRIVLSPSGSGFALYSESEARIYAFTDAPRSTSPSGAFDVGNLGQVTDLAVSDDAKSVAVSVSNGTEGSLFLLRSQQAPQLIPAVRHPSIIQFFHNSNDAIIADEVENAIYAFSGGQTFQIAAAVDGISLPAGIGTSKDNERVFVANSASQSITTIRMNEKRTQLLECHCSPTGLYPTSSDSIFRLTNFSGGPVLLFDGNSAEPRLIFVPAGSQF